MRSFEARKTLKELRHAEAGRLRSLLKDDPTPVLLIGAGASITSGIPAANATVERAAKWAWCKENGRHFDDPTVRPSDYKPWLAAKPWFDPSLNLADLYPTAIDQLLGVKRDRRDFFERLISPPIPPNRGYRSLAKILHQGWISTVLTTNFDNCVQKAATLENKPHHIVKIKTSDDLIQFSATPSVPQLVFLHGSVEHYTDRNLTDEVQKLDKALVDAVKTMLRDRPIIVVGYRGNEPSIMDGIFQNHLKFTNKFAQGVYWCTRDKPDQVSLSPLVQRLANTIGSNFNSVSIRGFDELFEIDLLNLLVSSKTPPGRRPPFSNELAVPEDMRPCKSNSVGDLDIPLLRARLAQYADKLNIWVPNLIDETWVLETAGSLHLISNQPESASPTFAGILLFGKDPTFAVPNARVQVTLIGHSNWLRKTLGDDTELNPEDETGNHVVERHITGNLWTQLDELTDLLSLVNFSFRLKAELSKQVQAYNPLALKEMLVNALVHRDYRKDEPIRVNITPDSVSVISPGGLVDEVAAQTGGEPIETLIKNNRRGVKGYRNPVISDLFYGGGQMDRQGSGLSDMWKETVNNNGEVDFGPDSDNEYFTVVVRARPEVVDEITNTAISASTEIHRFAANMLSIVGLPDFVWVARTKFRSMRGLKEKADHQNVPRGYITNGYFYSLFNLQEMSRSVELPFAKSGISKIALNDLLAEPNGRNVFVKLLNEAMFEHLRSIGLWIDYGRKRVHYPKPSDENEFKITYKGRSRTATRTVVKARTKKDSNEVVYYEHKALNFNIMDFQDEWAIMLSPGYTFTRNGIGMPIGRARINVLSTRRAAKDFNQAVHQDVTFWISMIASGATGVFALSCDDDNPSAGFAPTILLSDRPPTVAFGANSFNLDSEILEDLQGDLDDLEEELFELAEQSDEDLEDDEDSTYDN